MVELDMLAVLLTSLNLFRFCLAYVDKHIYMLGGYCEDEGFSSSVLRYSEADDSWDSTANMPRALR